MSLEIPILRHGSVYASLEVRALCDPRSGAELARVHQANAGLVARDLSRWPAEPPPSAARRAAIFRAVAADLSEGEGAAQHREGVAGTTGLTLAQVDAQVARLALSLEALAEGVADMQGVRPPIGFVLPSNAPGVHTAWLAALALGHPVILKPGRGEPWTPHLLVERLVEGGFPKTFFGLYPGDHGTAAALLEAAPYAVLFGDDETVAKYADAPGVDVRGPGRSKVYLTPEDLDDEDTVEALIEGALEFGGRSCLNTSTAIIADGSDADLERLQGRLKTAFAAIPDDELAAFTAPGAAQGVGDWLQALGGAADIVQRSDGLYTVRPSAEIVPVAEAPLSQVEAPFPRVSVVSVPRDAVAAWSGPTLAAAVSPALPEVAEALSRSPHAARVVGANRPTTSATDTEFLLEALRRLTNLRA